MTPVAGWAEVLSPPRKGFVRVAHAVQYPDPIRFRAGDALEVGRRDDTWPSWLWCRGPGGREGWVPDVVVEGEGAGGRARHDYSAVELGVAAGDEVLATARFGGWLWVLGPDGDEGWVPEDAVTLS